ncbi:MAG: transporter substrate-binding domain-containing protein [Clostridia bacterium]|nr:transporter substrate-binding domain-containing protein [Clostridia bacterium]
MKKLITLVLTAALLLASLFTFASCENPNPEDTLVCGVTPVPGLNEQLPDGSWTGFDTEFAMAVAEKLGMKIKFVEINWEQKYNEVNSGAIDAIWNGFTANSSDDGVARKDLVDFSYGYMLNQQCIVVKKDRVEEFVDEAALEGKKACAESGSAGQAYAESVTDEAKVEGASTQLATFLEVSSGAVDFAVVDIVLAQNVCGKGDYEDLAIVEAIELESEVYAVGFKKNSELTAKVNAAILELEEDGTLAALAEKYGFENVVKVMKTFE